MQNIAPLFRWEGGELNQGEGERDKRVWYISQSWVENTNMTECTQEIGYLQSCLRLVRCGSVVTGRGGIQSVTRADVACYTTHTEH
jgi:hypothetical protein